MFREKLSDYYDRDVIFSIIMGIIVGLLVVYICIIFNLAIWGFNIYLIFAPLIAGFVETYLSQKLTNTTSGAISSIVLFIVTNLIGWLFPAGNYMECIYYWWNSNNVTSSISINSKLHSNIFITVVCLYLW